MAANVTPIFVLTSNVGIWRSTAAVLTSDGTGSETLFTAGTNGSRLDTILIRNSQSTAGVSAAMTVRIYVTATDGTTTRLLDEVALPAATRSTTVIGAAASITFPGGLFLKSGQLVKCSVSVFAAASQVDIVAKGGDY